MVCSSLLRFKASCFSWSLFLLGYCDEPFCDIAKFLTNKIPNYWEKEKNQRPRRECITFKSAPAQKTFGTELQIKTTWAETSLSIVSKALRNPLNISLPIEFFAAGLSKLTSTIPVLTTKVFTFLTI